jgi:hypothetical protein
MFRMLKDVWAEHQLAKLRQNELAKAFAQVGEDVKFMYAWSGNRFQARLIREALQTDAATVAAKYIPVMRSAAKLCQHRHRTMRAAAPWLLEQGICSRVDTRSDIVVIGSSTGRSAALVTS